MALDVSGSGIIAAAGGFVGLALIISNAYHNWKTRAYLRRIATALEHRRVQGTRAKEPRMPEETII